MNRSRYRVALTLLALAMLPLLAFAAPAEALDSKMPVRAVVKQGSLEQSTVDPLQATMEIANAARAVETNLNVMSYSDRMMDRAINSLGRPA